MQDVNIPPSEEAAFANEEKITKTKAKKEKRPKILIKDLPLIGMSRFNQFESLLPFSREKFRQLSKAGKAPMGIRLGCRMTAYKNAELHKFLENITGYQTEVVGGEK